MISIYKQSRTLTPKQKLFMDILNGKVSQTTAYQLAYHCKRSSAQGNASKMVKNIKAKQKVARIYQRVQHHLPVLIEY